jgi:hypothetical protein
MADSPGWLEQLQQLHARLDGQIQAAFADLGERQNRIYNQEHRRWQDVGVVRDHYLDEESNSLIEVREKKGLQETIADFQHTLERMREAREWRDVEQTPEYQAWERARNRPIHEPDADELGWEAEQRFYAEQDPTSQWYREDLYHGELGPDVAIDLAEAEMRRQAAEQRFVEHELAFDESQLRVAAGEPFDWPTHAEQQAYEDRPYDLMEDRAHGSDSEDGEWSARPEDAPKYVVIDTTKPEMEESFQALLDRLDQRLDALVKETEPETQQLQQKPGVRY